MTLAELQSGEKGVIIKIKGHGAFRKRILEMGFIKGKQVEVVKNAPLKDPVEYKIMGYEVSLRKSEAELIEVVYIDDLEHVTDNGFNGVSEEDYLIKSGIEKTQLINIAFVGNPNCGKTTLFNFASKSKEHVGNYSGVTVDAKTAKFKYKNYIFNIVDLPGTYSLTAYTPEELFVRRHILKSMPDVVVNVIDSSNLERNLFLTTQLIDLNIRVVAALNMFDELTENGDEFDYVSLGNMIGIPFIPTVASKGKGIKDLFDKVIDVYNDKDNTVRHVHINYHKGIERAIKAIQEVIKVEENTFLTSKISSRFLAIKLLEKDKDIYTIVKDCKNYADIETVVEQEVQRLESRLEEDTESIIADSRYGFIAGALKETFRAGKQKKNKNTNIIDSFITHKFFAFPIFIFFMWIMFYGTFTIGQYPMHWIESLIGYLSEKLTVMMPDSIFKDLLIDGIVGGVGGVIVFLPNILILFFFISLMEDTGYMARAAFIMDKLMHKIGLHGKSFIPLIMGFGCNVPAIMATRTLENKNDRILTILINPFMSCSARLPVYVLLISAFFPDNPGQMLFLIYITGIFLAVVFAILFKRIFFKSVEAPFVMELPPYRKPMIKNTLRHMWHKGAQYLKKVGGIILFASIIIWALGYFPRNINFSKDYDALIEANPLETESLLLEKKKEQQEKSFIGQIGHIIEPVLKPLGFDWKMGVSLLSGVAAKEIVVSTMGVLYLSENVKDNNDLITKLKSQTYKEEDRKGQVVFSPLVALAFMLFILIYFPCIGVVATIKRETGSWKWTIFSVAYTTILAWLVAFTVYQTGNLLF